MEVNIFGQSTVAPAMLLNFLLTADSWHLTRPELPWYLLKCTEHNFVVTMTNSVLIPLTFPQSGLMVG